MSHLGGIIRVYGARLLHSHTLRQNASLLKLRLHAGLTREPCIVSYIIIIYHLHLEEQSAIYFFNNGWATTHFAVLWRSPRRMWGFTLLICVHTAHIILCSPPSFVVAAIGSVCCLLIVVYVLYANVSLSLSLSLALLSLKQLSH